MNEIIENIITRRSIKSYDKSKKVEKEKLDKILEAGTYAACGMGAQSQLIVVVQDEKIREKPAAAICSTYAVPKDGGVAADGY